MIVVVGDDNDESEDEEWNENIKIISIFLEIIHRQQIHTYFRYNININIYKFLYNYTIFGNIYHSILEDL